MSSDVINGLQLALRFVLALVFIGAGIIHFVPSVQRTMSAMIPPRMRTAGLANPINLVLFTGVCEVAGGLGLVYPPTTVAAGVALIIFLAAVFPANAYAAGHRERFGRVAIPLVPRLIAQLALMALILLAIL
ncbi:MAG: DoxX family protein [Cryobacterium sp.]|uniref:DoxX family protein n=1 Tax=unclassified Cryobacterium TaxID=2649013 RepID=UPI0018CBEC7B|nr:MULTISPECIES: DoxX family protein [unclassified Cryobacterium]MCY7403474.1 DoxX family protein [Cryobacterium sp.]MEC5152724.1 putative membrane protein [Cryobacterium sp. CAN_C3]